MDNSNKMKLAEHVSRILREEFTKTVGESVEGAEEKIKQQAKESLTNLQNQGLIANNNSPDVQVDILWNKWGLKQKAKWYLTNKLFPWIAEDTRDLHTKYDMEVLNLYEEWSENGSPTVESSAYRHDMPEWANPSPKNVLITNLKIRPKQVIEFIGIDIEINKD